MFQYRRKVQYHETDKMGITHHSNYIKWMEEARIAFLESIDLPFQLVEEQGIASPVVGVSVDYKNPTTFGDEVMVEVFITKYTGVKLEVGYTMKNAENGTLVAEASSKHAFLKEGRIVSLKRVAPDMHSIMEREAQAATQSNG